MKLKPQYFFCSILCVLFLTGPVWAMDAASPSTQPAVTTVSDADDVEPAPTVQAEVDPLLSRVNRAVFQFNDMLDRAILKPIARLYLKLVPRPLHQGITNFYSNIDNIPTFINDILQLNAYAFNDGWRLLVNTTVGVLGIFDVGSRIGLKPHHEDFGLTLARWGYKNSNYIVVPFFGPGTIRDIIGWPIDYFFFSIYPYVSDDNLRYSVYGVGVVDRRANALQYQGVFEQVAVDRYGFMRNAYMQHRNYQIIENDKPNGGYQAAIDKNNNNQ
ncbi:MAG TPA: VacJ family lipoprotein [Gammaproteobacteria bacterium]|nr:VacJ family lipoprotein [Gammaproteobacteria bacterium]